MLFNSLQFILFFIIITISYWKLPSRGRWLLLLLASCYFYMAFVPIYIAILGFTIVIDYFAGIFLEKIADKKKKKIFLIASIVANVGVLAIFKYYNFFNANLNSILGPLGHHSPFPVLQILLPIGLSFHTFQAMSYTIEVYRGNQKAEKHFGIYALYVMFYPQLVAGPIERPQNVLHQFHEDKKYDFELVKSGLIQMAFGFFKKVVIADRLSMVVDEIYKHPNAQNGATVLIGSILYSFQIYCDFSGYSDIGIGAARVMGFKLMDNFNVPYLSRSISEFWSKWHISLSTWFRDYLYIPLGGNRVSVPRWYFNLMVVFLVSGFWHGANWTFVVWGGIHGLYLISGVLKEKFKKKRNMPERDSFFARSFQILFTFALVTIAWIFFRAKNISTAMFMLKKIARISYHDGLHFALNHAEMIFCFILIIFLMIKEKYVLNINVKSTAKFYFLFIVLICVIYLFGVFNNQQFIYFQF